MKDGIEEQRDQIIHKLETIIAQTDRQLSVWHVFRNGIIYGAGFIIGSTVLTAFVVTVVLQFFSDTIFGDVIAWIARTR